MPESMDSLLCTMASEHGGSDRDVREYTAALLEKVKKLKKNAKAREERGASLPQASGGSGNGGPARERETAARSPATVMPTPGPGAQFGMSYSTRVVTR